MEVLKTLSMYVIGIATLIKAIREIKENTKKPLQIILCCLAMSIGIIGYVLLKEWLFLIVGLIGFILIFILG